MKSLSQVEVPPPEMIDAGTVTNPAWATEVRRRSGRRGKRGKEMEGRVRGEREVAGETGPEGDSEHYSG